MNIVALLLLAVLSLPALAAPGDADGLAKLCRQGSARAAQDPRILAALAQAREEHRLFGGQVIDRNGGIVSIGFHEAEFDRLTTQSTPTWKRVARFWTAVDEDLPGTFGPDGARVNRKQLFERIAANSGASDAARLDQNQLDAIASAFMRSALIDHPWSAVFISFLMKSNGFARKEFEFSDSHVDYVDRAFVQAAAEARGIDTGDAYRACDVLTTRPRAGDLICHTREGAAGLNSYAALRAELQTRRDASRGRAVPMHCDLVASADENKNAKIETIGGNVFQSVTLRQMTLNAGKTLSARYLQPVGARNCEAAAKGCERNLSRKPWVVLLQFRN